MVAAAALLTPRTAGGPSSNSYRCSKRWMRKSHKAMVPDTPVEKDAFENVALTFLCLLCKQTY